MQVFPIISLVTRRVITGTSTEANSDRLATAIDSEHGSALVEVGEPFEVNPAWSKSRNPGALAAFVVDALEPSELPEWVR